MGVTHPYPLPSGELPGSLTNVMQSGAYPELKLLKQKSFTVEKNSLGQTGFD